LVSKGIHTFYWIIMWHILANLKDCHYSTDIASS
jgi:hypothetical protein